MKKTQDIIGLPVFSVVEGRQVGQVKDLVINPEEGKVEYLLVSNGSWYVGARVLPYRAVLGIGDHAVTTESESQLTSITDAASANSLLSRNVELKGNRLLTERGDVIGKVSEYELDENSGIISRIHFLNAKDEAMVEEINADQVLTYGSDVVVVKQPSATGPIIGENRTEGDIQARPAGTESEGAALFKQRQREYLLGKKTIADLRNQAGEIIIPEGSEITEALIAVAEQHNKFVELSQLVK